MRWAPRKETLPQPPKTPEKNSKKNPKKYQKNPKNEIKRIVNLRDVQYDAQRKFWFEALKSEENRVMGLERRVEM